MMRSELSQVYKERLFSEEEISWLRELFDKDLETQKGRWQNITGIFKTESRVVEKHLGHFIDKQLKYAATLMNREWKLKDIFLLEYHPGGKANLHVDIHATNGGISLVTLVEEEELVGGQVIIREDDIYGDIRNLRSTGFEEEDHIIQLDVGETVVYSASVIHGVTKVESGFRRVLVTWLDPKGE